MDEALGLFDAAPAFVRIKHWSLRSLLVKLIKIGAKVVRSGRSTTFQMAEVAVSRETFSQILARIDRLRCCTA